MSRHMSMSYATRAGGERATWIAPRRIDARLWPDDTQGLLLETGSLTALLRARCRETFAVRVLRQDHCSPADYPEHQVEAGVAGAMLREVYLECDGRPVVFAQTLVPDETLAAQPWLAELGGRPLGEELFARPDVARLPFEFAELTAQHDLVVRALQGLKSPGPATVSMWARRSQFVVGGYSVSVNELFFPPQASHRT